MLKLSTPCALIGSLSGGSPLDRRAEQLAEELPQRRISAKKLPNNSHKYQIRHPNQPKNVALINQIHQINQDYSQESEQKRMDMEVTTST